MADEEEESKGGGWIVSFADLMTLLFAAFVVLYGLITPGSKDTMIGITAEIRSSFVEISDSIKPDDEKGRSKSGLFYFKARRGESIKSLHNAKRKDDVSVSFDRDKNLVQNFVDQLVMAEAKDSAKLRSAMNIQADDKGLTIKLMGAYFFAKNSYRFDHEGRQRFVKLGRLLKSMGRPLLIEGHSESSEGLADQSKEELSALRAANAALVLHKDVNLSPILVDTVGLADQKPVTSLHREGSRRIEIKIRYQL